MMDIAIIIYLKAFMLIICLPSTTSQVFEFASELGREPLTLGVGKREE